MKVFAAGDIHSDSRVAERLAEEAKQKGAELVILCGDLTSADNEIEGILAPFTKRGLRLAILPGNHDSEATIETLATIYNATNLHGYSLRSGNVGIFGCGGGTNTGPILNLSEEETFELLRRSHDAIKDAPIKVMVTHVHSQGTLAEKISFKGSSAIRKAIDEFKPHVHLCGHIHEADGIEEKIGSTLVCNVGIKGKLLNVFDIAKYQG